MGRGKDLAGRSQAKSRPRSPRNGHRQISSGLICAAWLSRPTPQKRLPDSASSAQQHRGCQMLACCRRFGRIGGFLVASLAVVTAHSEFVVRKPKEKSKLLPLVQHLIHLFTASWAQCRLHWQATDGRFCNFSCSLALLFRQTLKMLHGGIVPPSISIIRVGLRGMVEWRSDIMPFMDVRNDIMHLSRHDTEKCPQFWDSSSEYSQMGPRPEPTGNGVLAGNYFSNWWGRPPGLVHKCRRPRPHIQYKLALRCLSNQTACIQNFWYFSC